MGQIEMFRIFAGRHGEVGTRCYGSKRATLFFRKDDGKLLAKMYLILNGGESYSLVYENEARNQYQKGLSDAWEALGIDDGETQMTFSEIDGMWRNDDEKMRLFVKFTVPDGEVDILSEKILSTSRRLIKDMNAVKRKFFRSMGVNGMADITEKFDTDIPGLKNFVKTGGFCDVAGMDDLKEKIEDEVIWPICHKTKVAQYRITPPSGMLLYGPPGCGKTFFAKKIAEEAGCAFRLFKPSDVGGMIIHETQKTLAKIFEDAENVAPCILCFDEIDAIAPRRGDNPEMAYLNIEVNEFLAQLSGCSEKGIFVVGTTNRKDIIDPAVLRKGRLDFHIDIPMPDSIQRERLFETCLKGRPMSSDIDFKQLAKLSAGMNASDIDFVVNRSALNAARQDSPISNEILVARIETTLSETAHAEIPVDNFLTQITKTIVS